MFYICGRFLKHTSFELCEAHDFISHAIEVERLGSIVKCIGTLNVAFDFAFYSSKVGVKPV